MPISNDDLIEELALYSKDPLGFVLFAFPWGEPDSELEKYKGPDAWQIVWLEALGKGLVTIDEVIRLAVASGHGIGKSALVAWIILWAISTFPDTKGVVTANTENQLRTKTWAELSKWHRLFIGKDLFELTATAIFSVEPEHNRTWRIDMVPWSKNNTEAFAGLHNKGRRILLLMDEASAIDDAIFEVAEGALTDEGTEIIFAAFGNPTRNKGRFREFFKDGKFAHRWKTVQVDSRTVAITNKTQINQWVEDYGEDSDFVRVRVKGEFPRVDAESFIPYDVAWAAAERSPPVNNYDTPVLGVDVGRFGDDPSVIVVRKGKDAKTIPPKILFGQDTMAVAAATAAMLHDVGASAAFVDEGGVGGGVVDRLRMLQVPVIAVNFSSSPDNPDANDGTRYANKRAEIYGRMRTWLKEGGAVPEKVQGLETTVVDELTAPQYGMNDREAIQLERKKDMRRRGVKSNNIADALATTFAYPIGAVLRQDPSIIHETPNFNPFEKAYAA